MADRADLTDRRLPLSASGDVDSRSPVDDWLNLIADLLLEELLEGFKRAGEGSPIP
jgi:hypothetical protein